MAYVSYVTVPCGTVGPQQEILLHLRKLLQCRLAEGGTWSVLQGNSYHQVAVPVPVRMIECIKYVLSRC